MTVFVLLVVLPGSMEIHLGQSYITYFVACFEVFIAVTSGTRIMKIDHKIRELNSK